MTSHRPAETDPTSAPDSAARIDQLMAAPPAERPTIIVVGDDAVASITLPKRRPVRPAR
jgi:hypothetical protein